MVHNMILKLNNINKIYETLSADRVFFDIVKKNKDGEDNLYKFMLKDDLVYNNDKRTFELSIYNKPTKMYVELYSTEDKEEMIEYISKI